MFEIDDYVFYYIGDQWRSAVVIAVHDDGRYTVRLLASGAEVDCNGSALRENYMFIDID